MGRYPKLLNFPRTLSLKKSRVCMHVGDHSRLTGSVPPAAEAQQTLSICCTEDWKSLPTPAPKLQVFHNISVLQNIDTPFPSAFLHSAFQYENSKVAKQTPLLQYLQCLHECIPYASFNAQHQAAAQQSFPQFISISLISWCSCIVVWEQMPQASSPNH